MKRVFLILFLLILFAWWFNIFPSFTMNSLNDSIALNTAVDAENSSHSDVKSSKVQLKFKIIELFR